VALDDSVIYDRQPPATPYCGTGIEKPPFGKLSTQIPPAKLYHGTFGWNYNAISEGGISPGWNPTWKISDPQYVYLTETPELAANWVREAYENVDIDWDQATAAVFEVDTTLLGTPVEHDPKGGSEDWRYKGAIPASAVHPVYEADYTDDIPDPDEDDWRGASRWWRAAEMVSEMEPTVSFDFDDVLHYAPGGNPIDFWTPESYVPRAQYCEELRSLSVNHRIIVVTHRDPGMESVVHQFALMHGLSIDKVFCVGVRGSKRVTLEDESASIHYDDSPYVESKLRESDVKLVKVPRTAINDLSWIPDNMWDKFPEIYRVYAERVGVTPP